MKEIQKAMALAMVLALTAVVVLGAVGVDEVDAATSDPTIPQTVYDIQTVDQLVNSDGTFKLTGNGGRIVLHANITLNQTLNITSGVYEITSGEYSVR